MEVLERAREKRKYWNKARELFEVSSLDKPLSVVAPLYFLVCSMYGDDLDKQEKKQLVCEFLLKQKEIREDKNNAWDEAIIGVMVDNVHSLGASNFKALKKKTLWQRLKRAFGKKF